MRLLGLVVLALLTGCATGPRSYASHVSPVEHRAARALIGATIHLGAESVRIRPALVVASATVGQVVVSKAVMAVAHPDRVGYWTAGDALCDLVWSAAYLPLVGLRRGPKTALVIAGAWLASALATDQLCVP